MMPYTKEFERHLQIQMAAQEVFDQSKLSMHRRLESNLFNHHKDFVHWDLLGSSHRLASFDWRTYVILGNTPDLDDTLDNLKPARGVP